MKCITHGEPLNCNVSKEPTPESKLHDELLITVRIFRHSPALTTK